VNQPRHKLTGHVRAWGSRNSGNGRVYFNPEADRELALGLTHQWRLLRRYDRGLVQRLGLEVGDYWQQGFGGRTVWTATLAHDWAIGPRTRLGYGVRVGGRVYDGDPEDTRAVFARLERAL
jgi:biofilm PGA synthesis protein PgaA